MRAAKRFAVVATVAVLAAGFAPATAASSDAGKMTTSVVICCKG